MAAAHSAAAAVVAVGVAPGVPAAGVAPAAEVVVADATAATSETCSPRFDLPADATLPEELAGPADAAVSGRPDGWVALAPVAVARVRLDAEHSATLVLAPLDVQVALGDPSDPDEPPVHSDEARSKVRLDAQARSAVPAHSDAARC